MQRQTWQLELTYTYASSSFYSNSQLQFVPDFRGKEKKLEDQVFDVGLQYFM